MKDEAIRAAVEALTLAIQQNGCDMLLTGEELRQCERALSLLREAQGEESVAILKAALDAATSLETISMLAGRKTYGDPPIETYMDTFADVRSYAAARAKAAREAVIAAISTEEKKG
jgi:hypothetical protein